MHDLSVIGKKKKKGMRQKKKKYIVMMRSRQKKIKRKGEMKEKMMVSFLLSSLSLSKIIHNSQFLCEKSSKEHTEHCVSELISFK